MSYSFDIFRLKGRGFWLQGLVISHPVAPHIVAFPSSSSLTFWTFPFGFTRAGSLGTLWAERDFCRFDFDEDFWALITKVLRKGLNEESFSSCITCEANGLT